MAKPRMDYRWVCDTCESAGQITHDECTCGGKYKMEYVELPPEPYTRY